MKKNPVFNLIVPLNTRMRLAKNPQAIWDSTLTEKEKLHAEANAVFVRKFFPHHTNFLENLGIKV